MFKKLFKKITGIDKMEKSIEEMQRREYEAADQLAAQLREAERARQEAEKAKKEEDSAKSTPKDRATRKKEPWVGVLNTHVNKNNVRNGFFELDWNEHFVLQLRQEGYGVDGDPDEEIVDRWFRELCANVVVDGDYGGPVETGTIDIQAVKKNNL